MQKLNLTYVDKIKEAKSEKTVLREREREMAISVSSPLILRQRLQVHGPRCSSTTPDNNHSHSKTKIITKTKTKTKTETPQVLKLVVSGVTELLRLFSSSNDSSSRCVHQSFQFSSLCNGYFPFLVLVHCTSIMHVNVIFDSPLL